jgi:hypothetical protein
MLAAAAGAGCTTVADDTDSGAGPTDDDGDAGDHSDDRGDQNNTTATMTPDENQDDENGDEQAERKRELERLPEPSPLSLSLQNLYVTADREALAEDRDSIVYSDGRVRVSISLEPGGQAPEQYLPDEYTRQGGTIIAVVDVDDLVNLALEEKVRLVSLPPQPEPHD